MPDRAELKEDADILACEWMKDYVDSPNRGFYYTGAHIADYYYKRDRLGYIVVDLDFLKMNTIVNGGNQTREFPYLVADKEGKIVFPIGRKRLTKCFLWRQGGTGDPARDDPGDFISV